MAVRRTFDQYLRGLCKNMKRDTGEGQWRLWWENLEILFPESFWWDGEIEWGFMRGWGGGMEGDSVP